MFSIFSRNPTAFIYSSRGNLTPLACAIAQKKTDIEAVLRQFEDSKKNGVDAFKEFLQTSGTYLHVLHTSCSRFSPLVAADASPSTLRLKFHNAVKEGDIQLVTEMLNAIDYVDFMQPEGKQRDTALHVACRQGKYPVQGPFRDSHMGIRE